MDRRSATRVRPRALGAVTRTIDARSEPSAKRVGSRGRRARPARAIRPAPSACARGEELLVPRPLEEARPVGSLRPVASLQEGARRVAGQGARQVALLRLRGARGRPSSATARASISRPTRVTAADVEANAEPASCAVAGAVRRCRPTASRSSAPPTSGAIPRRARARDDASRTPTAGRAARRVSRGVADAPAVERPVAARAGSARRVRARAAPKVIQCSAASTSTSALAELPGVARTRCVATRARPSPVTVHAASGGSARSVSSTRAPRTTAAVTRGVPATSSPRIRCRVRVPST